VAITKWVKTFVNFSKFSEKYFFESDNSYEKQTFPIHMGQNTSEKFSESSNSLRNFENLISNFPNHF